MKNKEKKKDEKIIEDKNNEDKVKVVVSSLKLDDNEDKENVNTNMDSDSVKDSNKNKKDEKNKKKVNFFKTFYYSTINLNKLHLSVESGTSWVSYILILLLTLSIIMGFSLGFAMTERTKNVRNQIIELSEFKFEEGKIIGDIDISFSEENTGRLIIINTIDSLFDIRDKYKSEIDDVDQYVLFTKDTVYAEPGDSFEYSNFHFLTDKEINKEGIVDLLDNLLEYKAIAFLSGITAALIILVVLIFFSFFAGRFLITILTVYGVKTYDFKRINRMTIFLMSMPLIIYVLFSILTQLNILKLPIGNLVIYLLIYLGYILIATRIIKSKYAKIKVVKTVEDLSEVLSDITETTLEELEKSEKKKREERKKIKDKKDKKETKEKEKEKDEIVEGA